MKIWLLFWLGVASMTLAHGVATAQVDQVGEEANPLGDNRAKTKILIGPSFSINNNNHTGGFRIINDINCPMFIGGSGWGYMVGLSAEIQRWGTWSLIPYVTYESRPGRFKEELEDADVLLPDRDSVVKQSVSATSEIEYKLMTAGVMYKHTLFTPTKSFSVGVAGGPVVGWVLSGKIRQVLDLDEPLNATFLNPDNRPTENFGRRLIYADNEDIPGRQSFRFSLKAGLVGEIGLFNNDWMLSPGIYFDYGLSHVTSNENWNLNTLSFQIDLRHAL